MEDDYQDFRIQPKSGSGGSYLSNEIHYRVALLRKHQNDNLPNGHLHIMFNKGDNFLDRDDMIFDIKHILERFITAL